MLERFGLKHKILAFNGDNASANNTQAVELAQMDNSFSEENRIPCFNHTMQLSARTLLKPFNKAISGDRDPMDLPVADDHQVLEDDKDGDGFLHLEDELAEEDLDDGGDDDDDGGDDELELDEEEHEVLLEETTVVRETVAKVCVVPHHHCPFDCSDVLSTDPQALLCHHQFNHACPAWMASCMCYSQTRSKLDTARCHHSMELDI